MGGDGHPWSPIGELYSLVKDVRDGQEKLSALGKKYKTGTMTDTAALAMAHQQGIKEAAKEYAEGQAKLALGIIHYQGVEERLVASYGGLIDFFNIHGLKEDSELKKELYKMKKKHSDHSKKLKEK